ELILDDVEPSARCDIVFDSSKLPKHVSLAYALRVLLPINRNMKPEHDNTKDTEDDDTHLTRAGRLAKKTGKFIISAPGKLKEYVDDGFQWAVEKVKDWRYQRKEDQNIPVVL